MADNVTVGGVNYSTDDVTNLNGATVATGSSQTQRIKVQYGDDGTARDVSTAFPLPTTLVSSGGLATSAGSITAAAANTPGSAVTASTTAQVVASTTLAGNATFHIVATAFVGTLIFEGSVDGGLNYAPIMALREDGTGAESSTAISTAAAFIRQYTVALPGLAYFRVRCSAFTSGTAAVLIAPGPFLIEPNPTLAAGTASIGSVTLNSSLNEIGRVGELRAGTTVVTVTSTAGVAATATLPAAGAGLLHYITDISMTLYSSVARTGAAAPWVVTTTNLTGSPAWTFSTAGAVGTNETQYYRPTTPVKAAAANTATTVVAPAATGGIWRLNVTYFSNF